MVSAPLLLPLEDLLLCAAFGYPSDSLRHLAGPFARGLVRGRFLYGEPRTYQAPIDDSRSSSADDPIQQGDASHSKGSGRSV